MVDTDRLVRAAAANMAAWHDVSLRALGIGSAWRDEFWICPHHSPSIYFDAIVLAPSASAARISEDLARPERPVVLSDPFDIDFVAVGFERGEDQTWFARAPGPLEPSGATRTPAQIVRVTEPVDLADWEAASVEGFWGEGTTIRRGELHAEGILADPRLAVWLARQGGRPVSGTMTMIHAGVIGTYGTSTVPAERRRGLARAVAERSLEPHVERLPAVVQPTDDSAHLYGSLGFTPFATFRTWIRGF